MKILLIAFLIFSQVYAEDAIYLTKGTSTPFDGFLITTDKANEFRQTVIERDSFKALNDSLQKSLSLQEDINNNNVKKVNVLLRQNDTLATDLADARSTSDWVKGTWFVLGVLGTLVGAIAISKAAK